ncbi:UNVERIFIED_CONTAM: hypothetical protein Slati_0180600 [Sesamum latifolium]|uniref:Reverse transcriptase n=1 Tax=Sesamum latifolium TaxID=2727402 RepID=A0AAW2YBT4_9LAMI
MGLSRNNGSDLRLASFNRRNAMRWCKKHGQLGSRRSKFEIMAENSTVLDLYEVLSVIQLRVTTEMNRTAAEPFTTTEVKQAAFIIHVVLISKCEAPRNGGSACPISLCYAIVKITSKCVANRLKGLLDSIVSQTQATFIPGRLIMDNVLVAFEINQSP